MPSPQNDRQLRVQLCSARLRAAHSGFVQDPVTGHSLSIVAVRGDYLEFAIDTAEDDRNMRIVLDDERLSVQLRDTRVEIGSSGEILVRGLPVSPELAAKATKIVDAAIELLEDRLRPKVVN